MSKGHRSAIHQLSYDPPTQDEVEELFKAIHTAPPIASAITGAALVEHRLEILLRPRFNRRDDKTWGKVIGEYGPLQTLSQKSVAAYALGIVDQTVFQNLTLMRNIRNVFAHSKRPYNFNHQTIRDELSKICTPRRGGILFRSASNSEGQTAWSLLCAALFIALGEKHIRRLKAQTNYHRRRSKPKWPPLNSIFNSPASNQMARGILASLESSQVSPLVDQTDDRSRPQFPRNRSKGPSRGRTT